MLLYSREVSLVTIVHLGVKAAQAVLQRILEEGVGVVAANKFENYKKMRFYYAREGCIYEHGDESSLVYRGKAQITALMKSKKRLVFGDESGKVGIVRGEDISEVFVGEHVCCIARDGNSVVVATTVTGKAFVIDLVRGTVLQTIQVRDSAVVAVVKDDALFFIGRDSRLVCYKRVDDGFVRGAQTDAHYSEAMCLGVFCGWVVSAGRDAIIAFYEENGDALRFRKFYPRRRISACAGNVVAINNKASIDFYAVGEEPRGGEGAPVREKGLQSTELLVALGEEELDAALPQELPCRYLLRLLPGEAVACIALCKDHFAYTTQHKTRLYKSVRGDALRLEHLCDLEKCTDLLFFGGHLVLQTPLLISLFSLTMLEIARKISVPGYEKLFSLGDFLVFSESRILLGPALEESELNFPFRILDVFAGENFYFLSRTGAGATAVHVVTKFDVAGNAIADRKYIRDVHEVRGIAEFGGRMFLCSSSSVYSYGLGPEFDWKKTHLGELVHSMHATPGRLVLVHDDWAEIAKGFPRAADKKKFLKK
ncbi:UNVERIFIED_CONTAM: hypothetical protein PYX00_011697 [Menopon gallinae]|uniref:Uncharacterized protein n=1 Tax=Menopon gallinae TaxID=328185 RepID=A0AAW2H8F1_9NEOP